MLTKLVSPEVLLTVGLSALTSYGAYVGFRAETNVKLARLEEQARANEKAQDDLIALTSDVRAIKESVVRIENHILTPKNGAPK